MQVHGRAEGRPVNETIAPAATTGLARLPTPSRGDIFFDIEGDPFVGDAGLEYLFGFVVVDEGDRARYVGEWAIDREEEKRAFERFIDFVMQR